MNYTLQNVDSPSFETIHISVTRHGEKIYGISGQDIGADGVDKEDLYDYIYEGIYAGWEKE
ncbi:MAG: hypothetical protein NC489_44995, partial [Ruminococcus flavefaciens]|nr:hypothetical protein [Ruminococcus flavefaciens]